jgi:hypothetical protein
MLREPILHDINTTMHFPKILDQFQGNLKFIREVSRNELTPDEFLYRIETDDGHYYLYEVDFIDNFTQITDRITSIIGGYKYFVEAKTPPEKFEDTGPFKVASLYPEPEDFKDFKKFTNDKFGSFEGYFNFLIKI